MTVPGVDDEGCHTARRAMEGEVEWRGSVKKDFW